MSILRKVLTSATILVGAGAAMLAASSSASAANYSYGGVKYLGNTPAYTFQNRNGQMGNVTFFGARPTTLPSHSGQSGNVGPRPVGTVPVRIVPTPNIVRVR